MDLFNLFNITLEGNTQVKDVRTEKQEGNNFSYDVGEKLSGSKKELRSLKTAFVTNCSLDILSRIEKISAQDALSVIDRDTIIPFSMERERELGIDATAAKLKQLTIQRIERKPSIDTPMARRMYVSACRDLKIILRSIKTPLDWQKFITNVNEKLLIAFTAYRKKNKVTFSYELSNKEDTVIEDSTLNYVALGKKFINLLTDKTSLNSTFNRVLNQNLTWDKLLEKKARIKQTERKPKWERKIPGQITRIGHDIPAAQRPEDLVKMFNLRAVQFGHYGAPRFHINAVA